MNALRTMKKRIGASGRKINRAPSPLIARATPWAAIMLASVLPALLVIASAPVLPPLGFLMLISWMQLRPGLLPVWAGLPLGLFDDLYNGQPLGSSVLLWSIAAIVLDVIETRLPWRNFLMESLVATGLIAGYILLSLIIANFAGASTPIAAILPQMAVSILLYPIMCRFVALIDRIRLHPFIVIE